MRTSNTLGKWFSSAAQMMQPSRLSWWCSHCCVLFSSEPACGKREGGRIVARRTVDGGMWAGFVGGGAKIMVVGVEGARGWYVSRCLRMELSWRRLSWSWSLFTWRRELRIPSLGARADGYATAPSERTARAADSLLAKPRRVVWSRTTFSPPLFATEIPYPPRCFLRQAHTAHVKVTPSPFSRDSVPESWKRRASPWYTAAGKGKGKHGILEKTGALHRATFGTCASAHLDPALTPRDLLVGKPTSETGRSGREHPASDGSWAALPPISWVC